VPELPEVETVRAGLDRWVTGRTIAGAQVRHPRSVRRHLGGGDDLVARLAGRRIEAVLRRGKYLWLPLTDPGPVDGPPQECLVAHLGMSGQLLLRPSDADDERHLHVRIRFADSGSGGPELRFVDQRTFGGLLLDTLVPAADRPAETVPERIAHIARDPLDPHFDDAAFVRRMRRRDSAVKRALLDQTLVSGVGNIYADEALWRAGLHGERRWCGTCSATRSPLAARPSTRSTSTSTARAGTSTARWPSTDARGSRARAAVPRSAEPRS
jgi:formamidopyrimidine-DNA glycosylase